METTIPLSRKDLIFQKGRDGQFTDRIEAIDLRLIPIGGGAFGPLFPELVKLLDRPGVREALHFVRGKWEVHYASMIDWLISELLAPEFTRVCRNSYQSGELPVVTEEKRKRIEHLVRIAVGLAKEHQKNGRRSGAFSHFVEEVRSV